MDGRIVIRVYIGSDISWHLSHCLFGIGADDMYLAFLTSEMAFDTPD